MIFCAEIGIKQVDSCSFCGETTETLVHLFWNYKRTQAFWKKLLEWMSQKIVNLKDSAFSPFLCLGLVENLSNVLLHHLLIVIHYIYTCTCKGPVIRATFFFNLSRNIVALQVETHCCAYYHVCDQHVSHQKSIVQYCRTDTTREWLDTTRTTRTGHETMVYGSYRSWNNPVKQTMVTCISLVRQHFNQDSTTRTTRTTRRGRETMVHESYNWWTA